MGGRWWCAVGGGLRRVVVGGNTFRSSSSRASYHTIQAIPREYTGSRLAAKDRAQGRIPTVVFSRDDQDPNKTISKKLLLTTEKKQIKSILESVQLPFFCSTAFQLQIRAGSGSSHLLDSGTVLPIKANPNPLLQNVHRDPESGQILNLVFVWADGASDLKVNVPLVFKGEDLSPGIKKGGYLQSIRTSLKYQCPAELIPPKIEVDVSNLDIGDKVYLKDIEVNPSLKLLSKNEDMPICKIMAVKTAKLEKKKAKLEKPEPAVV
ncbi:hypothetical protein BVC80_8985g33 [Macleaya cordata]|uniref:Large ribosomal subunit protein bL25 beta domain-containing protein n=1 Tax=Macleaya cordata TaxID=56857 RepID=A0A200QJ05_MACCD|nr:hypothetical protein BVC80_8985g33 [Macleaya cordata]